MRIVLATLALAVLAALAASAAPAASAKLTPAEQKWAKPVVDLWNIENAGLLVVYKQATAKDALVAGTKTNLALSKTLANFVQCPAILKKIGTSPSGLKAVSVSMTTSCARLSSGAHDVAKGIGQIGKRNQDAGTKLVLQGFGKFKKASTSLAVARRQLLAVGAKSLFA